MRWKISRKSACHTCLWWSHGGENIKWRLENTGSKVEGICPRDTGIFREYVGPRDLLRWYVPELFEGMCSKDMSQCVLWGYVPEICCLDTGIFREYVGPRDLLGWYVPELFEGMCSKDMSQCVLWGYVPEICCLDTGIFREYVGPRIYCSDMSQSYLKGCVPRICPRVML